MKGGYALLNLDKYKFTTDNITAVTVEGIFDIIKNTTKRVVITGLTLDNKLVADCSVTFELKDGDYVAIFNDKLIRVTDQDTMTISTYSSGGGGGSGVQDVKVDGVSVVSDGIAEIELPVIPDLTEDNVFIECNYTDPDCLFAVLVLNDNFSVPASAFHKRNVFSAADVTIGEDIVSKVTAIQENVSALTIAPGKYLFLKSKVGSGTYFYNVMYSYNNRTADLIVIEAREVGNRVFGTSLIRGSNSWLGDVVSSVQGNSFTETVKFYKLKTL